MTGPARDRPARQRRPGPGELKWVLKAERHFLLQPATSFSQLTQLIYQPPPIHHLFLAVHPHTLSIRSRLLPSIIRAVQFSARPLLSVNPPARRLFLSLSLCYLSSTTTSPLPAARLRLGLTLVASILTLIFAYRPLSFFL